jgi:hypothetical protein
MPLQITRRADLDVVEQEAWRGVALSEGLEALEIAEHPPRVVARIEPGVGLDHRAVNTSTQLDAGRAPALLELSDLIGPEMDARRSLVPTEAGNASEQRVSASCRGKPRGPRTLPLPSAPSSATTIVGSAWPRRSCRRRCPRSPGASPPWRARAQARTAAARTEASPRPRPRSTPAWLACGAAPLRSRLRAQRRSRASRATSSASAASGSPKRPGALSRGAMRKPMSSLVTPRARSSFASSARARRPGRSPPPRTFRPARTSARLSLSSGATSATVPIATRSSHGLRSSSLPSACRKAAATENASPHEASPLKAKPQSGRCGLRNASAGRGSAGTRWWSMTIVSMPRRRGVRDALVIARAAIAGHEQRGPGGDDALERGPREAVAARLSRGEHGTRLASERLDDACSGSPCW